MNSLFEFNGKDITINPLLLSIQEFKKIWNRDKTKDKKHARAELTYIYGMSSGEKDNIWRDYTDLKQREKIIIEDIYGENSDWIPNDLVLTALKKYKQRYPKTAAEMLLDTSMGTMMKIKQYLDDIDLDERDANGKPVHNLKNILDTSKLALKHYLEIEEVISKVKANKKINSSKIRGGGEEGMFEDENLLNDLF